MKRLALFVLIMLGASWAIFFSPAFPNGLPSITFDDTGINDTVVVTYQGLDPTIFQNIQVTSGFQQSGAPYVTDPTRPLVEFGRITFFVPGQQIDGRLYAVLYEPPSYTSISDTLNVVATAVPGAGTTYDVFLESDYLGSLTPIPGFGPWASGPESSTPPPLGMNVSPDVTVLTIVLSDINNPDVEPVPEPTTMLLLGSGLLGLWGARRKFKK